MAGDQVDKLIDPSTSDEGSSGAKTARSLDLLQCMIRLRHFSPIAVPTACPLPAKADMRRSERMPLLTHKRHWLPNFAVMHNVPLPATIW